MTARLNQQIAAELFLRHLPARTILPMWLTFASMGDAKYVDGMWGHRPWQARETPYEERARGTTMGSAVVFYAWRALVRSGIGKEERRRACAALEADIRAHERLVVCRECGEEDDLNGYQGADERARLSLCFGCHHWTRLLAVAADPKSVRVNGKHYQISNEDTSWAGFRGFGGAKFIVAFNDGRRLRTSNLWSQGDIPWWFRERLPDNATFENAETKTSLAEWAALDCIPAGAKTPARTGLE